MFSTCITRALGGSVKNHLMTVKPFQPYLRGSCNCLLVSMSIPADILIKPPLTCFIENIYFHITTYTMHAMKQSEQEISTLFPARKKQCIWYQESQLTTFSPMLSSQSVWFQQGTREAVLLSDECIISCLRSKTGSGGDWRGEEASVSVLHSAPPLSCSVGSNMSSASAFISSLCSQQSGPTWIRAHWLKQLWRSAEEYSSHAGDSRAPFTLTSRCWRVFIHVFWPANNRHLAPFPMSNTFWALSPANQI